MEKDMTVGKPIHEILLFSIPVILGSVFQQLYNTVDTIIVGQFVGTKPLAAVGSTGSITFLILGLLMGMTAGFNVIVGQKYGAKDWDSLRRAMCSGMVLCAGIAVLLTAFSLVCMRTLLTAMQTPDDIYEDACTYVLIICGGMILTAGYNMFSGVLRAVGNSRVPLYALIVASFLNIVLDLVLTIRFHMGVAGTAYATVLSQGISALICFIYIRRCIPVLHFTARDFIPDFGIIRNQLRIGLPMGLQFSFTSIGSILVQRSLNSFGAYPVAAYTASNKVNMLVQMVFCALGTTMSAYCAQNMGARKVSRIREGFASVTKICIGYALVLGVVMFCFGYLITGLFVSSDLEEVQPFVKLLVRCDALFLIPLSIVDTWRNGIQGAGYGWTPMIGGVFELAGRGSMAFLAAATGSFLFIGLANAAAWLLAGTFFIVAYFHIMKGLAGNPNYT